MTVGRAITCPLFSHKPRVEINKKAGHFRDRKERTKKKIKIGFGKRRKE